MHGLRHVIRPESWPILLIPFAIGTSLAAAEGVFMARLTLYALTAIILSEIGISTLRNPMGNPATSNRKGVAGAGLLPNEIQLMVVLCLLAATVFVLPVFYYRPALVPMIAIGLFIAAFDPELPFRTFVLKKALSLIAFGPLLVNGSYYMQTGSVSHAPALLSIPTGLLIVNAVWIHRIKERDLELPSPRAGLAVYAGVVVAAFLTLITASLLLNRLWYLLPLFTLVLLPLNLRQTKEVFLRQKTHNRAGTSTLRICVLFGMLLCLSAFL